MTNVEFKVGMLFGSATEFRAAVREYAIKNGKNVKFVRNEKTRVRAVCRDGCRWMIFAFSMQNQNILQVKTYRKEYNCGRCFRTGMRTLRGCQKSMDSIRRNPKLPQLNLFKHKFRRIMWLEHLGVVYTGPRERL